MAETAPSSSTPSGSDLPQYWCYHCDKRVCIETLANHPDVICRECRNGFVESIAAPTPSVSLDNFDERSLVQVLRVIVNPGRNDDMPPAQPQDRSPENDFLRFELDGWDNDSDNEEDENDAENRSEFYNEELARSDYENEDSQGRDDEEELRRRLRDDLRRRIRFIATRRNAGRDRLLDWTEILMGLEGNSIDLQVDMAEEETLRRNPGDYADAMAYESLLQNLAEIGGGKRGAPAAAKLAVAELPTVIISSEEESLVCAICKDGINVGDKAKKLLCGHGYHGDCILPWLCSRNSCPVCRFELPTDDPDYEEQRRKKYSGASSSA